VAGRARGAVGRVGGGAAHGAAVVGGVVALDLDLHLHDDFSH